jgi:hypothetical protein
MPLKHAFREYFPAIVNYLTGKEIAL